MAKAKTINISPLEMSVITNNVIKKLVSDDILISTPAGSTACNLSVHGPILNLNSKKNFNSSNRAFRPRRWSGKIVSDKSKVIIKILIKKKTNKRSSRQY